MSKYFAREAMRGLLPDTIVDQPKTGILHKFTMNSFHKNRENIYQALIENIEIWRFYIKVSWVEVLFQKEEPSQSDLYLLLVMLQLIGWEKHFITQ
ncbi:MAG TPA: hypothetical protein ENK72_02185 [Epsilonproteobacteria bacterium]|nr:hypothetical protein [Campylobacterota bacterium]